MKILLLHRDLAFDGGVGQCFMQFARHYDPAKLDLTVGGLEEVRPSLADKLEELGVATLCLDGASYAKPAYRLRQAIRREGFDLIAATSFRAYVVAKAAAAGFDCRVVFWIHSIPLVIEGAIRRSLFRLLARRDTLVFVSKAVRQKHDFEAHEGDSRVVYNGVEDPLGVEPLEPYGRERRQDLQIPGDALVIGCIAEFVGWKNHVVLLRAFAELLQSHPESRLLLIGDGKLRAATLARAKELGVGDQVIAPGRRRDARKLLGLMDIYAHPADGEGFGLAVAEAMLAGLPAVVARAGALVEVVTDGQTGMHVEPGDSGSLAAALRRLASSQELRTELGGNARADCLERFSPERYADRLTKIFLAEDAAPQRDEAAVMADQGNRR